MRDDVGIVPYDVERTATETVGALTNRPRSTICEFTKAQCESEIYNL